MKSQVFGAYNKKKICIIFIDTNFIHSWVENIYIFTRGHATRENIDVFNPLVK